MDISFTSTFTPGGTAPGASNYQLNWSQAPQGTGDLPISELAVGIEAVCRNDNNKPREPTNVGSYKLRRDGADNQSSCKGGTDLTFVPITSQPFINYMAAHIEWPISDPKLSSSFSQTELVSLFKRPYVPFKKECRIHAEEMQHREERVNNMRRA
jgi:hypothetical protein